MAALSVEQAFGAFIGGRLRQYADTRFPQDWDPDILLVGLVDPAYRRLPNVSFRLNPNIGRPSDRPIFEGRRVVGVERAELGEVFIDQFVIEQGRGLAPTIVWQIDGGATGRRITTSRLRGDQETLVRFKYFGSSRRYRLREIETRRSPENDMLREPTTSDWSTPTDSIEIPPREGLPNEDWVRRQGDLGVVIPQGQAIAIATLDSNDPITVPLAADHTAVG